MRPIDDSFAVTSDERLAEVAGILAAGILRLHTRTALSPDATAPSTSENPTKSATPSLEVPDETVLSVHNG